MMIGFRARISIIFALTAFILTAAFIYAELQDASSQAKDDSSHKLVLTIVCDKKHCIKITGLKDEEICCATKLVIEKEEATNRVKIVINDSVLRTFEFTEEQGLRKSPFQWDALEPVKDRDVLQPQVIP